MANKFISCWLENTFTRNQLDLIPKELANKSRNLTEIDDVSSFIEMCSLISKNSKKAGQHRIGDWEKGWSGKGVYYSNDEYNNLPYYFKNSSHVRLNGRVYRDTDGFAEVDFLRVLQMVIFKSFLEFTNGNTIVEYGCGTGSNIEYLRKNLGDGYKFFAADWAESACEKLVENKILETDNVFKVNYFDEKTFKSPQELYIAFTNASLEQTGDKYKEFIDYLIGDDSCEMGIHIEPIRELLDLANPLNLQSFNYEKQRGYLEKFLDFLHTRKVKILKAKDYGIGSQFLSGYQVVVWTK